MISEQYTVLPEFYDRLNGEADYEAYVAYLDGNLTGGCSVIDLGCGTGDVSVALAKSGYKVTALDASSEMLSVAYNKAQKNSADVFFTCQDMTSFSVPHLFDAAISCFDSMNYILTKKALLSAFLSVSSALVPGGIFLFDMNTPSKFENFYSDNTFVLEEEGIFCTWENCYNKKSRRCNFYINIFAREKGGLYRRFYEEQCERSYKLSDITECLTAAGFEDIAVFSDFSSSPLTDSSQRFYFKVRKKQ